MDIINEGISDICYHFTTFKAFNQMLKHNIIQATQGYLGAYGKGDEKGKDYPFYISTTSTKSFDLGYQKQQDLPIRLTLNGKKINHNFKTERVSYYNHKLRQSDMKHNNISGADEMEDRVMLKKPFIRFMDYVLEVTIDIKQINLTDNVKKSLSKVKKYLTDNNIKFMINGDENLEDHEGNIENNQEHTIDLDFFGVVIGLVDRINPNSIDSLKSKLIEIIGKPKTLALINNSRKTILYSDIVRQYLQNEIDELKTLKRIISENLRHKRQGLVSEIGVSFVANLFKQSGEKNYSNFFDKYFNPKVEKSALVEDEVLQEGMSDVAYHFTTLDVLYKMVRNNKIMGSMAYSDSVESEEGLNWGYPFYLSTTSTSSFNDGFASFMEATVRLTLNGRFIKHNFKVKRVAFNTHSDRMDDMKTYMSGNTDEMEDRVLLNKPSIPFNKIVTQCTIILESNKDRPLISYLINEIKKWGIDVNVEGAEGIENDKAIELEPQKEFNSEFTPEILSFGLAFIDKYDHDRLPKLQELMKKCLGNDADEIYEDCKNSEEFYILYYMEEIIQKRYVDNNLPENHKYYDFVNYLERKMHDVLSKYDRESTLDEYVVSSIGQKLRKYRIKNTRELIAWTYNNVTGEELE